MTLSTEQRPVTNVLVKFMILSQILFAGTEIEGMLRNCYLGSQDYREVLKSECFVDKSMLIKEFIEIKTIALITAPRRFGKSVNMNMLRMFLQHETQDGTVVEGKDVTTGSSNNKSKNISSACQLFKDNKLNIYRDEELFNKHCGKHPVIYVTFKQAKGKNYDKILEAFTGVLRDCFSQHQYLLNSNWLRADEKTLLMQYIGSLSYRTLSKSRIQTGLKFLSRMLYTHFNKTTIVLIDEFDVPVWELIFGTFSDSDIRNTVMLIRGIITNLLKGNPYVKRALINACQLLSRVLTSSANKVKYFPFLINHNFTKYYGLTSSEVDKKLNDFNITDRSGDVKDWYDGYKASGTDITIYNTWSTMHFLETETLENYWVDVAGFDNINKLFLNRIIRYTAIRLLDWDELNIIGTSTVSINDLITFKNIMNGGLAINGYNEYRIHMYLYENGYFNSITRNINGNTVTLTINIPNNEMYRTFHNHVYSKLYFETHFQFDPFKTNVFIEALNLLGTGDNIKHSFLQLSNSLSDLFSNVTLPNDDHTFKSCIVYSARLSSNLSIVDVDVAKKIGTKLRTVDIIIISNNGTAMIIETKYNCQSAVSALKEIIDKSYYKILDLDDKYKNKVKKDRIYIGLYLHKKGLVKMCYLINSVNFSDKICI